MGSLDGGHEVRPDEVIARPQVTGQEMGLASTGASTGPPNGWAYMKRCEVGCFVSTGQRRRRA
jgi:hypothetical protein